MPQIRYPDAVRLDLVEELHGHQVADPYRYLEDVTDERTIAWSAAQDDLYAAQRATWNAREGFRARLSALHAVGEISAPVFRGDRAFGLRRDPDQEHAVLRVTEADGTTRVLLDPISIDPTGTTTLDTFAPSPDGRLLAYVLSEGGTEVGAVRVLDVATGEILDGPIDRVRYTPVAWLPGGDGFYFIRNLPDGSVAGDDASLYRRIYLHMLGADSDKDEVVYGEGAARSTYFGLTLSRDGRWLSVSTSRGTDPRNDLFLADLHADGEFVAVQEGIDARATLEIGRDGRAYILTDREAPRWRLCVADPGDLIAGAGYSAWRTLIAEDPSAVLADHVRLEGAELERGLLVVHRERHAISEVSVHDLETGAAVHDVMLPGLGTVTSLVARRDDDDGADGGHEAWFGYTDFTTPTRILRYDATTGATDLWAEPPGAVSTSVEVLAQHVSYTSYDGTEIRMFVVGAANRPDGPAPTIMFGYGGFDISLAPAYTPYALAWVEAGGVFAEANLRGGGEEGHEWHTAGRRAVKQNVFDDFHAAADWLVAQGLTTHEQLGIYGRSNGGLLVGAAVTQHPEKFGAVDCTAPLLDMVRAELFGLGSNWTGEYGSAALAEEFEWLLGYSPYHRVRDGVAYPPTSFTVFDGDSRVDPLHARKLCAAMQHATSGDAPILIRREPNIGHAGRAVSRTVELDADRLAFFAAMLGSATLD
jgi:prolyl oligopeptidase